MTTVAKKRILKPKGAATKKAAPKKAFTRFRPMIRSRHPSHSPLRRMLPLLPFRSVVRLGSTTIEADAVSLGGRRVECNTVQGVKNSANKKLMKLCFDQARVKTAPWTCDNNPNMIISWATDKYPVIAKSHHGSRGQGNTKLDNKEQLEAWMRGKTLSNYIFEKFISMTREYRLHVTNNGCFYTCRKLIKNDAPEGTWQRHDDVCNWVVETNPSFKKPRNWDAIVRDCINAKNALGLDICAFDVMVQGSKNGVERSNPEWIICESCSAPSFGDITLEKYINEIPKVLKEKHEHRI